MLFSLCILQVAQSHRDARRQTRKHTEAQTHTHTDTHTIMNSKDSRIARTRFAFGRCSDIATSKFPSSKNGEFFAHLNPPSCQWTAALVHLVARGRSDSVLPRLRPNGVAQGKPALSTSERQKGTLFAVDHFEWGNAKQAEKGVPLNNWTHDLNSAPQGNQLQRAMHI